MNAEMKWVQIDSWHLIAEYGLNAQGIPTVRTRCGLERRSSAPFLDRLPGGSETSCENCLKYLAGDIDEPAPKKKTRKTK